jgi:hypothetical protein
MQNGNDQNSLFGFINLIMNHEGESRDDTTTDTVGIADIGQVRKLTYELQ